MKQCYFFDESGIVSSALSWNMGHRMSLLLLLLI